MSLLDELTTGPLSSEIAPYIISGDDGIILEILNRKDRPAKGEITSHNIQKYLTFVDLLIPIEDSTEMSCRRATKSLEIFPSLDCSDPMVLAKLISILDGLVAEPLIPDFTEIHKLTILGMADKLISRLEETRLHADIPTIAKLLRG